MVKVNVHHKYELTPNERRLLFGMLTFMCADEDIYKNHAPIAHTDVTLTKRTMDKDGNTLNESTVPVSYNDFVKTVHKGLDTYIEIIIQTEEGDRQISTPLFPVTLTDIPMCKSAVITLDYRPDFIPKMNGNNISFAFRGNLLSFVECDKDNKTEE